MKSPVSWPCCKFQSPKIYISIWWKKNACQKKIIRHTNWMILFFFEMLCIYLKGKAAKWKKQRNLPSDRHIFHALVHSPNACHSQAWARPKPGAKNSILVSHVGGGGPSTWDIFHCCPNKKPDQKWSSQDWEWCLDEGCRPIQRQFPQAHHNTSPHLLWWTNFHLFYFHILN